VAERRRGGIEQAKTHMDRALERMTVIWRE